VEVSPEGTYKVMLVIGWVVEREALFCISHKTSREKRILAVCNLGEEKRMDVKAGRRDIYTRVPGI